jgi:antitoxin (DNA-binding transcriptional repressor) of toxin-antitoxin stability system
VVNITVDEIQRDPSKYLLQVAASETFLILQADRAIAELRPIYKSRCVNGFAFSPV